MVMRPCALRPPERLRGSSSERSGVALVMSVKSATDMPRRPAEVGLYWRVGMAFLRVVEEVDALTLDEGHVGLLPVRPAAGMATDAAHLAEQVEGADLLDLDLEQRLDGVPDLILVGIAANAEDELIAELADHRALLGDQRRGDDVEHGLHGATLPRSASTAARVTTSCGGRRMS